MRISVPDYILSSLKKQAREATIRYLRSPIQLVGLLAASQISSAGLALLILKRYNLDKGAPANLSKEQVEKLKRLPNGLIHQLIIEE